MLIALESSVAKRGGVERCDVGRMMGACVRGLESRHVREVSKVARR
jgi:hypothetical protein